MHVVSALDAILAASSVHAMDCASLSAWGAERVKIFVHPINGRIGRVFTSNARSLRSLRMANNAGSVHPLVVARNR